MEITGTVHRVLKLESGTGSKGNWVKQPFVIKTTDQYPKKIAFEAWNSQAEIAAHLTPGQSVTVHFNLESREHNDKWYTSARAWKIEGEGVKKQSKPVEASGVQSSEDDDLPF